MAGYSHEAHDSGHHGGSAELLYRSVGYVTVGAIPGFARESLTAQLEPTTIMYKELRATRADH